MTDDPLRSRAARAAAERALIRIVHHYGAGPEFVVLGGLVPELLCSSNAFTHAGTRDRGFDDARSIARIFQQALLNVVVS